MILYAPIDSVCDVIHNQYMPENTSRGGKRDGAGRPRSNKPRCACGLMTATRAEANRHRCVSAAKAVPQKTPQVQYVERRDLDFTVFND